MFENMYTLKVNYYNDNDVVFASNQYLAVGLKTNSNMPTEVSLRNFLRIEKKSRKFYNRKVSIWKYCVLIQSVDGNRFYYSCHIC
jgi:hypothetical protein